MGREVANELVISIVAGRTLVLEVLRKNMALLATVSPRLALLPTLITPPLTWVAKCEFTPLSTRVPKPVLNRVPLPLILELTAWVMTRPAPTSKPAPAVWLPVSR